MLLSVSGDSVATTARSRRSEHRSAGADFVATARRGQLRLVSTPAPAPVFEDTGAGRVVFALMLLGTAGVTAWQCGWLPGVAHWLLGSMP